MADTLAAHIPLLAMTIGVLGGGLTLAVIEPPAPKPVHRSRPFMPLHERDNLSAFGLPWVMTPPGDPELFADVRCRRYFPPSTAGLSPVPRLPYGAARRYPAPPAPVFVPQSPTPTTAELDALQLPA